MKKISGAFGWILSFQIIGYFIGKITQANIATWYRFLNKSILTPPEIVFPIVWSILYVILALIGWSVWSKRDEVRGKLTLWMYGIQMLLNWGWSPVFFSLHFVALGFYLIVVMMMITLFIILISWKNNKVISILLIPYWFWLFFASYLNWTIWIKNSQ